MSHIDHLKKPKLGIQTRPYILTLQGRKSDESQGEQEGDRKKGVPELLA